MNVAEAIEILSKCDPSAPLAVATECCGCYEPLVEIDPGEEVCFVGSKVKFAGMQKAGQAH